MNIALIGYGKMGKTIERIALERKHKIVLIIDENNASDLNSENLKKADVAIDFSLPSSAYNNILTCFSADVPVVCGTTGWLEKKQEVIEQANKERKTFFYASNYSIGVNVFFQLNKYLASLMNKVQGYEVSMEEIHHIHKLDAPSGTALSLAEDIIDQIEYKEKWVLNEPSSKKTVGIKAIRKGEVPGTHSVNYHSEVDFIQIQHVAHSREGFAMGAVMAAEYIIGKTGYHTMDNLLRLGY
ncbi:MAG: 4-hydroxy-tetrahydrodipicolinate reductase [Bacteroidota bacterium]|nr:MAG: 4-hydroxy-tetrahydrodipicolinate reductase [Bacteroidota bacterium]